MTEPPRPPRIPLAHALALADRRFEGRQAFGDTIAEAIECGVQRGWRQAAFCDADFVDWPLGGRGLVSALDAWARSGCRFTMLAQRYDALIRHHDRFVQWRRRWSHQIDCWQYPGVGIHALPSACLTSDWLLHRIDPEHGVCVVTSDAARRLAMQENLAQLLRQSVSGFAATTLGL